MNEAYQVYMDTLRAELGSAPPVPVATIAQRAQDSAEGMHSQTRVLQGLAVAMLLVLLMLSWSVSSLSKSNRQQLQLLKQLVQGQNITSLAASDQCQMP